VYAGAFPSSQEDRMQQFNKWRAPAALLILALLSACGSDDPPDTVGENACLQYGSSGAVYDPGTPGANGAPEIPTGFASKKVAFSRSFMVVAANPLATKAGCEVLKKGGSAVDAAIATQMVLNLVEPQSSGHRRRRLHAALRPRHRRGHGLRRARDGPRSGHRKLPALDQRHAADHAAAQCRVPAAAPSARRACCTCWTQPTRTPAG
jgi:hypothetical protein